MAFACDPHYLQRQKDLKFKANFDKVSKILSWKQNINKRAGWEPVAHTCNPSYSGDRDQEDHD
jgi:hypothetical protein